jgi:hypothetical protein
MDGAKSYKTAGAFRAVLETRLQTRAREQATDLQRLRRQVAFDRFLARLFSKGPKATYPWVLKGLATPWSCGCIPRERPRTST